MVRKYTNKRIRGGSSTTKIVKITPTVTDNQTYGYDSGGTSQRSNALAYQTSMNSSQNSLNSTHGGTRRRRNHKGGSGTGMSEKTTIPQFASTGPSVSPYDANQASQNGNQSSLTSQANSTYDCWATKRCNTSGGSKRQRRRRGGDKQKLWGCYSGGRKKSINTRYKRTKCRGGRHHRNITRGRKCIFKKCL